MLRLTIFLTFVPVLAIADPGHLGELAGHDHWIALGAIGLAAALGLWAKLKGRKDAPEEEEAESDEGDAEEVPA